MAEAGKMTPERLRECLKLLGLSMRRLDLLLKRTPGTTAKWRDEITPMPVVVAEWLEARAQHAEATPPPPLGKLSPKPSSKRRV